MVTDGRDEGSKPLEDVREAISDALKPPLVNTYLRGTVFPALMEEYGVVINEEAFLPDESVPADSLMQMAQELMGTDPDGAIQYFELFLHRFPEHPKADQAMFLIGFTFSEQLNDYEAAGEIFERMIRDYPESELADDASWMIDNMETPIEDFLPVEEFLEVPAPQ
jgi:tetratricopeptide (TPR) repeat protein